MQTRSKRNRATAAAGLAAGLAAAITSPAAADPIIVRPPDGPILTVKPDLRLESMGVAQQAGGWQITAVLKNLYGEYPGGGQLRIIRTSGGTLVSPPPSGANDPWLILPDSGVLLASKPIPKMAPGATLTLTATSTKRGIFRAEAGSVAPSGPDINDGSPLVDANPANNSKQSNYLIPKSFDLTTTWAQTYLDSLTDSFRLHLDRSGAYTRIVGSSYVSNFNIPEATKSVGGGGIGHWAVRDVNYQDTAKKVMAGRLVFNLSFETTGVELDGYRTGPIIGDVDPDLVQDYHASPMVATVEYPLSYQSGIQFLTCGQPIVTVSAPLLGVPTALSFLKTDFTNKVGNAVRDMFSHELVQRQVEYHLNHQIRAQMLKNEGRIVSVQVQNGGFRLNTEVAQ